MNEPKIRFQGFEEEWEEVLIEETFGFLKNNSLSRAELSDHGNVVNIHYGDVLIKYPDCLDVEKEDVTFVKDSSLANKLYRSCPLQKGDVIFADAAEDNTVGKCTELVNCNSPIISGLHTISVRPLKSYASRYLGYYLNSPSYHNQLLVHIQGTKISSISKHALAKTLVAAPKALPEQQAIAQYFTHLDTLITTSASRLASLKQMKAASLQAMFPQEGETMPKIRFKGFVDNWKEKKIEEVAPLQRGFDLPTHSICSGNIPIVYSNGIQKYHNVGICEAPGLITGRSGTIGKFTYVKSGKYWPHNTSLWVTDFKKNYPLFVFYLYQTISIEKYATGSGVPTLNRNDVHKIKVSIPSFDEQQAIASYFTSLDKQITLQTQRLEKLKQIKSACLDKMFV